MIQVQLLYMTIIYDYMTIIYDYYIGQFFAIKSKTKIIVILINLKYKKEPFKIFSRFNEVFRTKKLIFGSKNQFLGIKSQKKEGFFGRKSKKKIMISKKFHP